MSATYFGFFDEMQKIAIVGPAIEFGLNGPLGKGGRSPLEEMSEQGLKKAKSKKDKAKALKRHAHFVRGAETGGAVLGSMAATGIAGKLGATALAKSLERGEEKAVERFGKTTQEGMARLSKHMGPGAKHFHVKEFGGDISDAFHAPSAKNSGFPFGKKLYGKILKKHLEGRDVSKENINKALKSGMSFAPAQGGIHIGAHELGHGQFGASRIGRAVRMAKMPAGIGGLVGSTYMATRDPDSKASKWAPAVGALGVAPILGEEAKASMNAIRAMKRAGHSPAVISTAKKQLAKAWGTYGMALGMPAVATPYMIRKLKQHRLKKRKEQGLKSSEYYEKKLRRMSGAA